MSLKETDALIDRLTADVQPVQPLAAPEQRALVTLLVTGGFALIVIVAAGDMTGMRDRYAGREWLMMAESGAMLATAILAIVAAFILSVPGRTKRWMIAPLPTFLLWFGLSGVGCLLGPGRTGLHHTTDCLTFIVVASLVLGTPLLWRLSKAHPIDPLPVALLGGLGAAAWSAFLLQFFHPFGLTLLDLAVHCGAVLLVLVIAALSRRGTLAPA